MKSHTPRHSEERRSRVSKDAQPSLRGSRQPFGLPHPDEGFCIPALRQPEEPCKGVSKAAHHSRPTPVNRMNSMRVRMSSRTAPSMEEVVKEEPTVFTPRRVMQLCSASTTTPTP